VQAPRSVFLDMLFAYLKALIPVTAGIIFILSYFFPDRNEFLRFFAHFPGGGKVRTRITPLLIGLAFILVAVFNLVREVSK